MPVVILTFTPSDEQLISGIPRFVDISTNQAATIYYTTDGTLPTLLSSVYTDTLSLPTNVGTVILSAVAYYLDEFSVLVPSAVLTETYLIDQTDLTRTRYVFFEGIVYSYPGGRDIPFYYDYAGDVSFSLDVDAADLLSIQSDQDTTGAPVELINAISLIPPNETASLIDNDAPMYATPNGAITFNPDARVITIDGRSTAESQTITLINGPHMSLRKSLNMSGGVDFYERLGTNYISGSATKYFINRNSGTIVFYYVDTNSGRWIRSIQPLAPMPAEIGAPLRVPIVFKWINFGRQMGTY